MVFQQLRRFQSDEPMAPYLFRHINSTLREVMQLFVKSEILNSFPNISKIDVKDQTNLITVNDLPLSHSMRQYIKANRKSISDKNILIFRSEYRKVLQLFCEKVTLKSPLKTRLCKAISFLDPEFAKNEKIRNDRFSTSLELLVESKWIDGSIADKAEQQLKDCCVPKKLIESLENVEARLDHIWLRSIIPRKDEFKEIRTVIKIILILSHGNASLERGFSINKECLVENQSEVSLVAQRQVYDAIYTCGGIEQVDINKELLLSHHRAHSRYETALKQQETQSEEEKRKKIEAKENKLRLEELQEEKEEILKRTEKDIESIEKKINFYKKR